MRRIDEDGHAGLVAYRAAAMGRGGEQKAGQAGRGNDESSIHVGEVLARAMATSHGAR